MVRRTSGYSSAKRASAWLIQVLEIPKGMQMRIVPRSCDCISDAMTLASAASGRDALTVREQRLPDLGDFEAMRAAFQQHRAHLLLELTELAAQRRFRRGEDAQRPD